MAAKPGGSSTLAAALLSLAHWTTLDLEVVVFSSRSDEWTIARWRQPNVSGVQLEFSDDDRDLTEDGATPFWKDLTVASALALALWAIAAVLFLG